MRVFDAQIVGCEARGKRFATRLDRTAFYPGGGGQLCDTGALSAGGITARVLEAESLASLTALGIPVERWSPDDLAQRVPVMNPEGVPWALFEPEAGALMARPAASMARSIGPGVST